MGLFSKLRLIFTYGPELETYLKELRAERVNRERWARRHHLNLCLKHQQEQNRSHFSEHNCHYCRLVKENAELRCRVKGVPAGEDE